MNAADTPLPPLRQDLRLFPQAPDHTGAAAAMIYDPVQHSYFRMSGRALELLSRWSAGTSGRLAARMRTESRQDVHPADIESVSRFLVANGLAARHAGAAAELEAAYRSRKFVPVWKRAVHNYLFFRVPLLRPARMLARITPWFGFVFHPAFWFFVALSLTGAVYLVAREWDVFMAAARGQVSASGLMMIAAALVILKSIHELGHAIAATRAGCRVANMGVAFMVLFPVLYTDTTDAWRLPAHRRRMTIALAGVIAELTVAVFALLLWAFLPEGFARSLAFALAVTAPVTTLLININPFLRFDGYFVLSDLWRLENLQPRSFALARWRLREILFGLGDAAPEHLPGGLRRRMIIYGWLTWIYRFFLFLAIALFIYAFFVKVVGIILFAVEILFFILLPVFRELKVWWSRRRDIVRTRRALVTAGLTGFAMCAIFVPWSTDVHAPAMLQPSSDVALHVRTAGRVVEAPGLVHGRMLQKGDIVVRLASPDLVSEINKTETRIALLRTRMARIGADSRDRAQYMVLKSDLAAGEDKLAGLRKLQRELVLRAPMSGIVTDAAPDVHPGRWIRPAMQLARIVAVDPESGLPLARVRALAVESAAARIAPGDNGRFIADDATLPSIPLRLSSVARTNEKTLSIAALAVANGGTIAAEADASGKLKPVRPVFAAELEPSTPVHAPALVAARTWRGVAIIEGRAESMARKIWRRVARVAVRESGF